MNTRPTLRLLAALAALAPLALSAQTTLTWTGATNGDWNTAGNWSGAGAPPDSNTEIASFTGASSNLTANVGAATTIRQLSFGSGASSYTITGGVLTIDNVSATAANGISNSSGVLQTIDANVTFNNSTAGAFAYTAAVTNAGSTLTFNAGRTVTTTAENNSDHFVLSAGNATGTINFNSALTQVGANFTQLQVSGNGTVNWNASAVTGNLSSLRQLGTGRLNLQANVGPALGMGGASQTGVVGSVYLTTSGLNYSRAITFGLTTSNTTATTYTFGSDVGTGNSATYSGTIALLAGTTNATYRLDAKSGNTLTFSNVISGGNANAVVRAFGPGEVRFTGTAANTFTAASVQVDSGTLALGKTAGVDAIGNTVALVNVASGATLRHLASNQIGSTVNLTLSGGTYDLNGFSESLGTLDVASASFLTLGTTGTVAFADSELIDWTGGSLSITGTFLDGVSVRFGTDATGLTSTQLGLITVNSIGGYTLDSGGYLTAIPEPSAFAALVGLSTLGLAAHRRRRRAA